MFFFVFAGLKYKPQCHIGSGYVDINEPCELTCSNVNLAAAIGQGQQKANMTCLDKTLNYKLCTNVDSAQYKNLTDDSKLNECKVSMLRSNTCIESSKCKNFTNHIQWVES